jgi:hypothetical protein
MNSLIKFLILALLMYFTLCFFNCLSNRCALPENMTKSILAIELLADDIIMHKSEILLQNIGLNGRDYRFECGKNQDSNALKNIDLICLQNSIMSFHINNKNDDIIFFLQGKSDFFKGQIIERKLFFSTSNKPNTTYEDHQIRNKCYKKITHKTWYVVDEISN